MTNPNDDFTSRGWLVATATLAVLIVVSFIPPIDAGGVSLRRASIISDLITHNDHADEAAAEAEPEIDVAEFEVDLEEVASQVAEATASATPTGEATSASWEGIFDEQPTGGDYAPIEEEEPLELDALLTADFSALLPADSTIVSVEEFRGDDFDTPMGRLYEKLLLGQEPVRVAFMGDSFVEGDILTADLRELLQDTFTGGGVGFVPVASPLTGFRQTVKTTSKGWTPYNIMQRRTVPEPYVGDFFVSGWVAKASAGASTRWEMSDKRRHLQECQRARLTFICREAARIAIRLNDGEERLFDFEAGDIVRQIVVEEKQIRSLEMRVESCFPGAAVVVMGVSDRAQRDENGFAPMDEAPDLVRAQREAAERCRVAFWNTYEAMQRKGGMIEFVAQGWAGKDYTHINYAGGREVARALYHALLQGAERHSRTLRQRMEMAKPVIENPLPMIAQPMPELPDSLVNIIPIE